MSVAYATHAAMLNKYRLLVFDWDGTLIDSAAKIIATVHAVTDEAGLPRHEPAYIRDLIGLALPEAVARLFPGYDHRFWAHAVERYRDHFVRHEGPPSPLFPGVRRTLELLRNSGYVLAVATGKSRRGLERELDVTGLRGSFAATRCADETSSKPNPLMLKEIMNEVAIEPHATVMVGDTLYDLHMAMNAGVDAIAVTYGMHEYRRLQACGPRACLDAITELPVWLENRGGGSAVA